MYGNISEPAPKGIHDSKSILFMEREVRANDEVLKILKEKYEIKVIGSKAPYFERNNSSCLKNMDFVREKIDSYVKDGVVEKLESMPWYCNPISVASKLIYKSND